MARKMLRNVVKRGVQAAFTVAKRCALAFAGPTSTQTWIVVLKSGEIGTTGMTRPGRRLRPSFRGDRARTRRMGQGPHQALDWRGTGKGD